MQGVDTPIVTFTAPDVGIDGAALAYKLQKLTPNHMLHAGRYSALGTDIGYHVNKTDTLITEAKVRKKMRSQ